MIQSSSFGKTPEGKETKLFHLQNGKFSADVTDFGATLIRFVGPDRSGNPTDVVLGFDNVEPYTGSIGFMGATVGRFCNRIEKATFTLNGKEYKLAVNSGPNHIHGGIVGFNHRLFNTKQQSNHSIEFSYLSPDGEEGYPGNLDVQVTYSLGADGSLSIEYYAICDADTIINLTNHTYFNLNGAAKPGNILDHDFRLAASAFCDADEDGLANGNILAVRGTPFDFREGKKLREGVNADYAPAILEHGLDHNFVLDGNGFREFASLYSDKTGIEMICSTDQPGVQIYSGNFLKPLKGKYGAVYEKNGAVCIETQVYPNSTSFAHFTSPVLKKGEIFRRKTTYKLTVK